MLMLNRLGFKPDHNGRDLQPKPDISFKDHLIWCASNVRTLELDLRYVHPTKAVDLAKLCLTRLLNVQTLTVHMKDRIPLPRPILINDNGNVRLLYDLPT